jgi:CubicO group peptidase (beta-lactamase class C family)
VDLVLLHRYGQLLCVYAALIGMAKNNLPGASIGVVENGAYEWAKGFGMADLENSVPVTPHTLFRLASIAGFARS